MRRTLKLLLLLGIGLAFAKNKDGGGDPISSDGPKSRDPETGEVKTAEQRRKDSTYKGTDAQKDFEGVKEAGDIESQKGRTDDGVGEQSSTEPGDSPSQSTTTEPSGTPDPNNKPRGEPEEVKGNGEKKRGIRRQNEAAETLAEHGYDVEQSPAGKENGKNPDYKIEGEYFDCYSPKTDDPGNIRTKLSDKIKDEQTERIVLNLDDSSVDQAALRSLLERSPIAGLEEIKIVQNGQVINFYPF